MKKMSLMEKILLAALIVYVVSPLDLVSMCPADDIVAVLVFIGSQYLRMREMTRETAPDQIEEKI